VESEESEAKLQSVAKAEVKANQSAKIGVRLGTMTRKTNTHYPNVDQKKGSLSGEKSKNKVNHISMSYFQKYEQDP